LNNPRVRFAPSPSGAPHIGNGRTALFNWLYARANGGRFILRIEDTDHARSSETSEQLVLDTLFRLGLCWDEGPDIGGPYGPYRQSGRQRLYARAVRKLLETKEAYPCYCSPHELEMERKAAIAARKPPRYSGKCSGLTGAERSALEKGGIKPAIRFKAQGKKVEFHDTVRGGVYFDTADFGDFIIMRSDATASYLLASAVDDMEMGITDVIRGEDHLSNTPMQILIMRALGHEPPRYAHLPMILGPDGSKLSKRQGSADIHELLEAGYLPDAINTAMAMLGWSGVKGNKVETLEAIAAKFDLGGISRSPSRYDKKRLDNLNSKALRSMEADELFRLATPALEQSGFPIGIFSEGQLLAMVETAQESVNVPADVVEHMSQFVGAVRPDEITLEILKAPETSQVADALKKALSGLSAIDMARYKSVIESVCLQTGLKGKRLYQPVRAITTGATRGPKLVDIFTILGPKELLKRIDESEASRRA